MSKYRCPKCGAMHKEYIAQCRLCGQLMAPDMVGTSEVTVRKVDARQGGIKGFLLIGIVGVLVILIGALALGFVKSNSYIDKGVDMIPGLAPASGDGWSNLSDPEVGFAVDLPGSRTKKTTETGTAWSATISKDSVLEVGYTPAPKITSKAPGTTTAKDYLLAIVDESASANTISITKRDDHSFRDGLPSLYIEAKGALKDNKELVTAGFDPTQNVYYRRVSMLKGDRIYFVSQSSIYKIAEMPEFDRMAGSFTFVAPDAPQ